MFGHNTYLIYVLFFTLIPIGLTWAANFDFLRQNLRVIALSSLLMFLFLCATDPFAEAWQNWFFSGDRLLGLYIINFPIEEALFFLLVPIAVASFTVSMIYYKNRGRVETGNAITTGQD